MTKLRSIRVLPHFFLRVGHALSAMSCAHREIQHLARLLEHITGGLKQQDIDRTNIQAGAKYGYGLLWVVLP